MMEIITTPLVSLDIDEFTRNVEINAIAGTVTGDGIFDTLMETATKHLLAQFEANRIRQEDYANAYIHIYEVTLQAALKAWLEKDLTAAQIRQTEAGTAKIAAEIAKLEAELQLIPKQLELMTAQIASEASKKAVHNRQIEAFDEDYKHKLLKILMDAWSVGFSVAKDSFEAAGIPATMQKVTIDDLYNTYIKQDLDAYKYKRESSMLES